MKDFEPKKISFGLCLIQGFAGGMLGGFTYLIVSFRHGAGTDVNEAIEIAPFFILAGTVLGSLKATFMWAFFELTDGPWRATARVASSSIVSTLFVVLIGLYFEFSEDQLTRWLALTLSMGTPVAMLVGSRLKPWELFTFGSIAVGEVGQRSGSRSILGTIGTLPLRFLSIGLTAFLLLYVTCEMQPVNTFSKTATAILLAAVSTAYPALSAYLTFRSPRKVVLIAIAVITNTPIALVALFSYSMYSKANWLSEAPLFISIYCGVFVAAWLVFLVARLSARLKPVSPLNNKSIAAAPNLDHPCLGSRFAEWEHVA